MNLFIDVLIRTVIETVYLTGVIILIGFLLGILRNSSIKNFQRSFGMKAVMVTAFIGVPIHELSHAIVALVFRHRINDIKLLQRPDSRGVLGYVNHSYNPRSIYEEVGNFFIGIAPIFGGIISIIILMRFLIKDAYNKFIQIIIVNFHMTTLNSEIFKEIINSYLGLIKTIFSTTNLKNPYFYVFIFLAICISSHISLSSADIKGASRGLAIIFIILFVLNILGIFNDISKLSIERYNIFITSFLLIAVILSVITFIISVIFTIIKN
ncbi:hypothetical protein [Clostridium guangxiense]|uniref:hypothetical protein n=1 Tax=Clostridium guangxiense TaxID=1662055 RepID=UPI001E3168EE|nr:hypothetical protein [Clostridium guangxiense]MCD2348614.1 hypothetical protein [Clostridium guangxiense]